MLCFLAAWEGLLQLQPWQEPVWGLQQSPPGDAPQVQQVVALLSVKHGMLLQAWGQKLQQELHAQHRAAWQQCQTGAVLPAWTLSYRSAAVLAVRPRMPPCWMQQGWLWQAAPWGAEPVPALWQLGSAWWPGPEAVHLLLSAALPVLLEGLAGLGQAARPGGSLKR